MDKTTSVMAIRTTTTSNCDEAHLMLAPMISRPCLLQLLFSCSFLSYFLGFLFQLNYFLCCFLFSSIFFLTLALPMPPPPNYVIMFFFLLRLIHRIRSVIRSRTESVGLGSYLIDSGGIGSCRIDVHRSESERSKGDRTIQDLTQISLRSEPQLIETSMIASDRIFLNRNPTGPSCMEHFILLLRRILRHSKLSGRC